MIDQEIERIALLWKSMSDAQRSRRLVKMSAEEKIKLRLALRDAKNLARSQRDG